MSQVNEKKPLIKRRTLLGGAATAAVVLVQTTFGKVLQKAAHNQKLMLMIRLKN